MPLQLQIFPGRERVPEIGDLFKVVGIDETPFQKNVLIIRLTRLGADAEQQQTLSEPETPRRSSQDG